MAMFVHMADARMAARIRRGGLRAQAYHLQPAQLHAGGPALPERAVFCVPVVPNIQHSLQWLRVLKAAGYRTAVAVRFRVADSTPVWAEHYLRWPRPMSAAEAVALFLHSADPRGFQVLVPRSVAAGEIVRIDSVPQTFGWRYQPDAHARFPRWPERGGIKSARLRAVHGRWFDDPPR